MWRRGPVCACTRVCWCRQIFTYIYDYYDYDWQRATTTTTIDYDEQGRYLYFRLVAQKEEEPPDIGGGWVFSLDAALGLLATRWRLGCRGDSSAMRSALVV